MVSLFMNVYQAWEINIKLSYIIEDLKTNSHIQTILYNSLLVIKDYISE